MNKGGMTKAQMAARVVDVLSQGKETYQGLSRATVEYMYLQLSKPELIKVYNKIVLGMEETAADEYGDGSPA